MPNLKAERNPNTIKGKAAWLDAHRKTGIITVSCKKTGIGRTTVFEWIRDDPEFAKLKDDAEKEAIELLEAEVHRRAFKGTLKPVYYKGKRVGKIREYSDSLAMFVLKAKDPKYRDKVTNEITTPDGRPPEIKVTFVSPGSNTNGNQN